MEQPQPRFKPTYIIIVSLLLGLGFGAFLIHREFGEINTTGWIILGVGAVFVAIYAFVMFRIENKKKP